MDLVPGPYSASAIASLEAVAVVDITSPTELNSIAGTVVGERRVAYQVVANDNLYTVYYWDSADGTGASSPYVVAGSAGYWIAAGGRYTNSAVSLRSTLLVSGAATLSSTLAVSGVTTISVATAFPLLVTNTIASSTTSGPFLRLAEDDGAAMASGDRLGGVLVGGARDASSTINSSSGFSAFATEAWSSTAAGSNLVFHTVANTTLTRVDRMTIGQDGLVAIVGAATVGTTLGVTGLATLTAGLTTPAQITSTIATGTAPLVVASTTVVGNLNVSQLLGSTWAAPGTIGSGTPATGAFTTLSSSGLATLNSASITTTLGVTGAATLSSTLAVTSTSTYSDSLTASVTGTTGMVAMSSVASGSGSGALFVSGEDDGAALASGDRIGGLLFRGSRDAAHTISNAGAITAFTTEAWSGTAAGTEVRIETVANTTTTRSVAATFGQDKSLAVVGAATIGTTLAVSGVGTFQADANVGLVVNRTGSSGERGITLTNSGNGTKYNWKIAANSTIDQAIEIIPSTAVGGSTYTTPALSIAGATSLTTMTALTVSGALTVNGATTTVNGINATSATVNNGASESRITAGNSTSGYAINVMLQGSTHRAWLFGAQYTISETFEIIPSTAAGGTTFTTPVLTADYLSNVVFGSRAALATNATDGFAYMPTCAGTPTGTPTGFTGKVAWVYDTTNNKICVYNGAWKQTIALL